MAGGESPAAEARFVRQHATVGGATDLFFLRIEAHPKPSHPERARLGGAWAACWVATDDATVAESNARGLLERLHWDAESPEESYPVDRSRYRGDPTSLARFDQALSDGVVVDLHTWPLGASEP